MTDRPIIVTGANGDIADAAARILKGLNPSPTLIGCDISGAWPGRAVFDAMERIPPANSSTYVPALEELVRRNAARLVIPTTEPELGALAQLKQQGADLPLLMNAPDVLQRFLDKLETANWLQSIGLPAPMTTLLPDALPSHLPLMVKPRCSRGSRGLHIVTAATHLAALQEQLGSEFVAQELVGGEDAEFTCPVFRAGDDIRVLSMKRRLAGGMTVQVEVVQDRQIDTMLQAIAAALPERAFVNVQLRMTDRGPRIFEINPRFSGTLMLRHRIGFSDLLWAIEDWLGNALPPCEVPVGAKVYRRYTELVVRESAA